MLIELIPAALHEQRLDRVVSLISDISRASTATLISVGGVQVDGVVATAGKVKVREGQQVSIDTALLPRKELPQPDPSITLEIVYQDADVAVINKAPGMVVHPGAGNPSGTMVNGALALFPEMATVGDTLRPGVVHRLDAGTTGLMVMARTQKAYEFWWMLFLGVTSLVNMWLWCGVIQVCKKALSMHRLVAITEIRRKWR